jgi:hypothetical protein
MKGESAFAALDLIADRYLDEALTAAPLRGIHARRHQPAFFRFIAAAIIIFLVWTGVMNLFPAAAYALSRVPLLRRVVAMVTVDPSIRACLANDFAQYVGESQTTAGCRSRVCYMVADAAHISVFFNVAVPGYSQPEAGTDFRIDVADAAGNVLPYSWLIEQTPISGLFEYRMDRIDTSADIPASLVFDIHFLRRSDNEVDRTEIGQSTYTLTPNMQAARLIRTCPIGQSVMVAGQVISLERLDVYPTQMRLLIHAAETNTLQLETAEVSLSDSDGREYPLKNSLSGSFSKSGDYTCWFESAYFESVKTLTLTLSSTEWTSKQSKYGMVHWASRSIDNRPAGVTIASMELTADRTLELVLQVAKRSQTMEFAWRPIKGIWWIDPEDPSRQEDMLGSTDTSAGYWSAIQNQWIEGEPNSEYHVFMIPDFGSATYRVEWCEQLQQNLIPPWSVEIDLAVPASVR